MRSTEAGLKYFVLGALASGLLLYGASLIYGFTGTTSFVGLAQLFAGAAKPSNGLIIGLVLVAVGLAFKVSAVPFHTWAPDTYEGAPTPITAFLSVASKAAGFVAILQLVFVGFFGLEFEGEALVGGPDEKQVIRARTPVPVRRILVRGFCCELRSRAS